MRPLAREPTPMASHRSTTGRAVVAGVVVALLAGVAAALCLTAGARIAATAQGEALAARTPALARAVEVRTPSAGRRLAAAAGATVRPDAPPAPATPPAALRPMTPSGEGWEVTGTSVRSVVALDDGRVLVVRQALPAWITPGPLALGIAAALAVLAGLAATLLALRSTRRAERREQELADSLADGRAELARHRAVADAGLDVLSGAVGPMRQPVAARGPAGRLIRNEAFEQLVADLPAADRGRLETSVADTLASTGPVARAVETSDGRRLEVEGWAIPGGRLVAVTDTGEQRRLAELRRRISGGAAARLGAPLAEARAAAGRALVSAPRPAADEAARALAAIDRAEQLVGAMLRGGDADPLTRRERPATVGVAGTLWALAQDWERRSAGREVHIEVQAEPGLPAASVDPGVMRDIMDELMRNAVEFTPEGGRILLRAGRAGRSVRIEVSDSGPGFDPDDLRDATEAFVRGSGALARPGAGLGLFSAATLARRAGGRLAPGPGPGGRVVLDLPAAPAAERTRAALPGPAEEILS